MSKQRLYKDVQVRLSVPIPPSYLKQLTAIANKRFEGNRSMLFRSIIRDFLNKELGDKFIDELN